MSIAPYIPAVRYGNLVDNGDINPAISQSTSVTLTSAQILGMFGTPVSLVTTTASGGVNQAIVVESCVIEALNTTTTYTAGGAIIVAFNGSTATGSGVLLSTFPASIFSSTTSGYYSQECSATSAGALVLQANSGITIGNQGAAFATGTGTLKVNLNYYIVTL